MEYLYIGFDATGWFKIGITNDYKKRRTQMRTANPVIQFAFVFVVEKALIAEIECHTKFHDKRKAGEWFDLESKDLKWIYDKFIGGDRDIKDFEILKKAVSEKKVASMDGFMEVWNDLDVLENGYKND